MLRYCLFPVVQEGYTTQKFMVNMQHLVEMAGHCLYSLKVGVSHDMAINPNVLSNELLVDSIPDVTRPQILSAEINYGVGLVRIFCTETIDVTPPSLVNFTQIFIVDETGDRSLPNAISLEGASINITDDSDIVTIKLTETQRVNSIMISGTPGGDGTAAKFDAFAPCIRDIAGNHNPVDLLLNLSIYELPDEIPPTISLVSIDYNTGLIVIFVTEQVPDSGVHLGNMTIADNEHGNISSISLVKSRDFGDAIQYMQGAIDLTKKTLITLTLHYQKSKEWGLSRFQIHQAEMGLQHSSTLLEVVF